MQLKSAQIMYAYKFQYPVQWNNMENNIPIPEVPNEPLSEKDSHNSGYSGSGNNGYCSSNQSETQPPVTGKLPDDSSGLQTGANRDSIINHYSTIALVENGDVKMEECRGEDRY